MLIKLIVIVLMLVIIGSLASGLFFLVKDNGQSQRTVKALTIRIGVSLFAFLLLMLAYAAGWVQPHGV